jgi:hypothetical protein
MVEVIWRRMNFARLYTWKPTAAILLTVGTLIESKIFVTGFISARKVSDPSVHLPPGLNRQPLSTDLESKNAGLMPSKGESWARSYTLGI